MTTHTSVEDFQRDSLDDFLIHAAIKFGRVASDVGGALLILAHYADGDDCGLGPTHFIAAFECSSSAYMEGVGMLDASGICVPARWRIA
jgi:hypothetical protein